VWTWSWPAVPACAQSFSYHYQTSRKHNFAFIYLKRVQVDCGDGCAKVRRVLRERLHPLFPTPATVSPTLVTCSGSGSRSRCRVGSSGSGEASDTRSGRLGRRGQASGCPARSYIFSNTLFWPKSQFSNKTANISCLVQEVRLCVSVVLVSPTCRARSDWPSPWLRHQGDFGEPGLVA
jgi:hypothetical protein